MTIRNLIAVAALPVVFVACGGSTPAADAPKPAETAAATTGAAGAPAVAAPAGAEAASPAEAK